jgi:uracil-DNA glycosylase family 4
MGVCESCPLRENARPVPGYGPRRSPICIVGEAPGYNEARLGRPFVGASGQLLDATLADVGLSRDDIFVTNAVCCRPTKDGKDVPPTAEMLRACSPRLVEELRSREPTIIITMGSTAAQRMLHTKDGVGKVGGVLQWSGEVKAWILPTYHPAAVLHGGTGYFDDIYDCLKRAKQLVEGTLPFPPPVYDIPYEFVQEPGDVFWALKGLYDRANRLTSRQEYSLDTESHGPGEQPRPAEHVWDLFQISYGNRDEPAEGTFSLKVPYESAYTDDCLGLLRKLLRHPNIIWDYHNLAYDFQVLHHNVGKVSLHVDDTMALGLCLTERGERVGLKALSRMYLNAPYYEEGLPPNIFKVGPQTQEEWERLAKYGAYDAYNTRALRPILEKLAQEEGDYELYQNILLPAQRAFARAEAHGAQIDREYAREIEGEWLPIIQEAEQKIQAYAVAQGYPRDPKFVASQQKGIPCPECVPDWAAEKLLKSGKPRKEWRDLMNQHTTINDASCRKCMKRRFVLVVDETINVRSPQQLQHLSYDILNLTKPEGRRSCDAAFLEENAGHPLVTLLTDLRQRDGLLRHYVYGFEDDVWEDGRVHPDFLLFGTVSGRLAVHNPPVQTLPKWQVNPKLAKMVRKLFRTRLGWLIVEIDYSAIELYTAADATHDMALYEALTVPFPGEAKADFHRTAAAAMFGKPRQLVTGDDRFNSKFVTYGVGYGRQAYSLANGELAELTGGDVEEAQKYIDRLWQRFPDWKRGRDEWERQALEEGVITTAFGRKRRWKLITPELVGAIRNQAASFVPQSEANDRCLMAFTELTHGLPDNGLGHTLFPVHDSIVAEVPEARLHEAVAYMVEVMTKPIPQLWVKLSVDVQVGPTLGEVEDYKP